MERTFCEDCGERNELTAGECRACGSDRLEIEQAPTSEWAALEETVAWDTVPRMQPSSTAPAAAAPPAWTADDESAAWAAPVEHDGWAPRAAQSPWVFGTAALVGVLISGLFGFAVGQGETEARADSPQAGYQTPVPGAAPAAAPEPLPTPPQEYASLTPAVNAGTQSAVYPEPGTVAWQPPPPPALPAARPPAPAPAAVPVLARVRTGSVPQPQRVASAEAVLPPPPLLYGGTPREATQIVAVVESNGVVQFAGRY
jgi:hypothetical protein